MSDDLTVIGSDGIRRSYDEHYDTMMDVEQDPTGAHEAIQRQHSRIEELEAKLDWVLVERDETFALMLDRAQTAEAKLSESEAILAKAVDVIDWALICWDDHNKHGYTMQGDWVSDARTTLAELKNPEDSMKGEADAT